MAKIVIALGGNALGNSPAKQQELVKIPAQKIVNLLKLGHQVIVGHGNGPQVGMIFNGFSDAKKVNPHTPIIPFAEAGAMSQGYIGYHLLNAINNELIRQNLNHQALYFLTQTVVDQNDLAFKNPTKPVGPFYATKAAAQAIYGPKASIVEDAGRGYRLVVASPQPKDFLGLEAIKANIEQNHLTIVAGGGGIPTIFKDQQYQGVAGVIDKDLALAHFAKLIDADCLIILTGVDRVFVNYQQANQKALEQVDVKTLKQYIEQNQFAPGSMLPKVEAAISFVENNLHKSAIIANLNKVELALEGKTGTKIVA